MIKFIKIGFVSYYFLPSLFGFIMYSNNMNMNIYRYLVTAPFIICFLINLESLFNKLYIKKGPLTSSQFLEEK